MWQRFTERARKAVFYAQEEAQKFGEGSVSTEHLLLGLVREDGSVATRVLEGLGVNPNEIRAEVEKQLPRGDMRPNQDTTLTPRAKRVIDLAYDEARNLNNNYIGTEHLLLGLIREGDGLSGRVMAKMGLELEHVRRAVIAIQYAEWGGAAIGTVFDASRPEPEWAKYSEAAIQIVVNAAASALRRNQGLVFPAHLMESLLESDIPLTDLLASMGIDANALMEAVTKGLDEAPTATRLDLGLATRTRNALHAAWGERLALGAESVEPQHLLLGLAVSECLSDIGFAADTEAGRQHLRGA